MGSLRKAKLAINSFRSLGSKFFNGGRNPIREGNHQFNQFISSNNSSSLNTNISRGSGCAFSSLIRSKFTSFQQNHQRNLFLNGGGRRFYYVDRNQVQHFKPRGPKKWFENPRNVLVVVLISGGVIITVYAGNCETIPYTKRTHFVLLSKELERQMGEESLNAIKNAYKGKILPAIHPESVKVRLIAKDIIGALERGIKHEQVWSDPEYSNQNIETDDENSREAVIALIGGGEGKIDGNWRKEEEVLDDKWVQESRKKGREKGAKVATHHLEGMNWEVLVIDEPIVNAFCIPGGKIVVFTGLLDHFRTDAEIATIISHEVGHVVARHGAEQMSNNMWFTILQIGLMQFVGMPDLVNMTSQFFLKLPFSRRNEMEADYIGVLLLASAGYDPRVAPQVYEKLGEVAGDTALNDYLATHPSGKKRALVLSRAKVMEEAFSIYRESSSGRGVEGFL
ncbi:hypothetical protein C5167_004951 [Papaver somniferum]|uniref:Peptidase M48 domain-containing protein n=1 Tax=Papaver somniferum TaxID=3469 RepID=A0A4Y7JDC6_PAPSO|nr:uncharacterized protein LOC113275037 [Papaver somniferum]RZC57645.1 hypothetical protein C5167_004951 [Papaver somniferum]